MTPQKSHTTALGLIVLTLVTACAGPATPTLQPIGELPLDNMSDAIRGQMTAAIAVLRADEQDPQANGNLGMLFDAYSKTDVANALYARARFLDSDNFRWVYLHGQTLARLGDDAAAIDALERALELRPGYPSAQLALAGLVHSAGDKDSATQLYTQLIERNPAYAQAHFEYGKLLFEQGQLPAALTSLETALRLSNRYGQAYYTLAQVYRELGDEQKASRILALFERFRRYAPASNDPLRARIDALNISDSNKLERALILNTQGKHQQAATALEELALTTETAAPHINLVAVYGEMGNFDNAQEHADIAMSIQPESLELLDNIGILNVRQRRLDQAASVFLRAIDVDPEYSVPYKNLGAVLETNGDLDGAIANYRRAVTLDPYDRQANYLLAKALLAADQTDQAIALTENITGYPHPEAATYFQLLGRAYEKNADFDSASIAFRRAIIEARSRGQTDIVRQATAQLDRILRMSPP